jgi:ATP-binding cassette subfamily F protein uup
VVTSVIAAEGNGRWIEYAGGYSDMLAQRGPVMAAAPQVAIKVRVATQSRPQRSSTPRRMTFKDRHALETLPARITALQADVERLNAALTDADLYTRDPARFSATTMALEAAQTALAAAEEQWLTLEMLREELEG